MKRRSQTQAQKAKETKDSSKQPKAKAGALTVAQLSSDAIWQVGAPRDISTLCDFLNIYLFLTARIAVLGTGHKGRSPAI